ncbi:exported hypothetical protein [uncultured Mycobacterium sp.]|uniref:Uncharacterized protein n=1 Tax=uncultured Mycobacterium sp. TaxID=171292 RepID=A0A1Y5PFI0_9MYCO|nr:exported hypothetical protein [uncultured Mycobacterium sp.]
MSAGPLFFRPSRWVGAGALGATDGCPPSAAASAAPHLLTVSKGSQRNRPGARAVNPRPAPVPAAEDICGPPSSLTLAGRKSAGTTTGLFGVDSPPSADCTAPQR